MKEIFLYTAYFIAITVGFPTDVIQNVTRIDNPVITKLSQGPRITRTFSKPRISVSNMYRSSPFMVNQVNPIDNLLLYLLLSAGRDFSEEEQLEQQREERRRSPDLFGDFISEFNKATLKVANGTKATLDKIEDIVSRVSKDDQETHNHPVASEGTCMCFNRVFRSRPNRHFEPIVRRISTSSSSDQNKPKINALQPIRKTTVSVSGWRSNHTIREDVTQQSQQILDDSLTKSAENGTRDFSPATVRVLRVADLIDDVKNGSPSPQRSSPLSHDIDDDLILELQQGANEETGLTKKNTEIQPPWLESIRAAEKVLPIYRQSKETLPKVPTSELVRKATTANETTPSTEKTEDDGYYFLSYSGGTDKRTTANKRRREQQTYDEENTEEDLRPPPFGPFRRLQQISSRTTTQKSKKGTQTTKKVVVTTKHSIKDVVVQHLNKTKVANETKLANATKMTTMHVAKTTQTSTTSKTTPSTTTKTTPSTTTRITSTTTKMTFRNHPGVKFDLTKDKRDDKALKSDHKLISSAKKKQEKEMLDDEPEVPDAGEDDPEAAWPVGAGGSPKKRQEPGAEPEAGSEPEAGGEPGKAPAAPPGAREPAEEPAAGGGGGGGAGGGEDDAAGGNETTTEGEEETPDPNLTKDKDSGNKNFVMVSIPTAIGLMIIIAVCCYCTRPGGAFCYNFLRKPGQPTRKQKRAQDAAEKEAKEEQQAAQKKGVLKASADQKQQQRQKLQMQKEREQQRKVAAYEREQAKVAADKEKKLAAQQKQKDKEMAKKEAARNKKEAEKAQREAESARRRADIKKQRDKARAARDDERVRFDEAQAAEEKNKAIEEDSSVMSGPPKQRPGAI